MSLTNKIKEGMNILSQKLELNYKQNAGKDYRGIVFTDIEGNVYLLDQTQDCKDNDIFAHGPYPDENGITLFGANKNQFGVYYVEFDSWCDIDYEGHCETGVHARIIKTIAEIKNNFLSGELNE